MRLNRRLLLASGLAFGGALLVGIVASKSAHAGPRKKRVLVVTVTKGFRHADSIPVAEKVIAELGATSGKFDVDYVRTDEEMAQKMTLDALKSVDAVFFASTTGDLPLPDRDGFLQWIKSGHAFIGTHAASDTFHGYPAFIEMIGGEFKTHGAQVKVDCLLEDKNHAAVQPFGGKTFSVFDEIYQFQRYDWTKVHALLGMDKHPNDKTPGYYAVSWCKDYGKGRVFYTSLGHRVDVWQNPTYQAHVLGGVLWALKEAKGSAKLPKPDAKPAILTTNTLGNSGVNN